MRGRAVLLLCASALTLRAQLLTNDGAAITVQAGAQLTVQGDVTNMVGATIDNDGLIDLSGDFTNNSGGDLFGTSVGTVILNGGAQAIGGSSITLFNNLSLVGGPVTLAQDIRTGGSAQNGVLSLGASQLLLSAQRLSVLNPLAGAITRSSGFIVSETDPVAGYGEVQWFLGASAPGSRIVPFGSAITGHYLPVTLDILAPGSGGSGSITCSTYPTDPLATPNNRPLPNGLPSLTDIGGIENAPNVVDRFWPMHADGFSTPPTATITFSYRDSEWNLGSNAITEPLLQAQRFDGAAWTQPPGGAVDMTANTVTTVLTNNYGVVWALVQSSSPLPVELLDFTARPEGDAVRCAWRTASEINNDFFTVERSTDGVSFSDVGEVQGAGNSLQLLEYGFVDRAPSSGLSYYRLRQTDLDGTEEWSAMVAVVFAEDGGPPLLVWPNPCETVLNIAGMGEAEQMSVMDAAGRVMIQAARLTGMVDVSGLAAGPYSLAVRNGGGTQVVRFVKR